MAQYRFTRTATNDIYRVKIVLEDGTLSQDDATRMQRVGEPSINVGGTILDGDPDEFTLPDEYIKLKTGFPYYKDFDTRDTPFDTNTNDKVNGWISDVQSRIDTAYTSLRAEDVTFAGEEIYNV